MGAWLHNARDDGCFGVSRRRHRHPPSGEPRPMPAQSIHAIVRERADALIAAFHTDMLPTVIATRDLPGLAWLSGTGGASVERLDAAKDSAMIWRRGSPALSSLWIRKSRRDYR